MTAEPSAALDLYATGVEGDPGLVVHPDDSRPGGGRPAGGPGRFGRSRTGTAALPGIGPVAHQRVGDVRRRLIGHAVGGARGVNGRSAHQGKKSGRSTETRSGNRAGRFSRNAVTPSRASAEAPRAWTARESSSWADIGWSAPSS